MTRPSTLHLGRRTPLLCLGVLALLGLGPAWCPARAAEAPEAAESETADREVVARWKGGELTRAELESWRAVQPKADEGGAGEDEGEPEPSRDEILELVYWQSLAEAAEAAGLDASPRVRLRTELARRSILVPALRRQVISGVAVSEEEVEAQRRARPDAFHRPRRLKLRNLYLPFGDRDPAAVRREMEEIRRLLAEGADFEALATERSRSQTAARGGFLGFVAPEELPESVATVVAGLAPGEIGGPVEHGGGVTLFLCEEVQEGRVPTADEVRSRIRQRLLRQRAEEAWSAYREGLLRAARPRIAPESPDVVLELPGYRLDRGELDVLVSLLWPVKDGEPNLDSLAALLEDWAAGVVAVRRAGELDLDQEPATAEALRWKEVEVLAQAELARRLEAARSPATREQLRAFFDAHSKRYREPAAYDLAMIDFGKPREGGGEATLAEALTVAERLASGKLSFDEAARRHSRDPSGAAGGGIGWRTRRQVALWGPSASRPIFALDPGEATGLLHLTSGLKIFFLRAFREERPLSFEEAEDAVRTAWQQQRVPALEEEVRRQLFEEIGVELWPETDAANEAPPRTIRWATASEFESYGFDVYRGESEDGPFTKVNEETIPGAGTTDIPHHYVYEDATAEAGKTYFYYVEAISTSGGRRRLTPIRASTSKRP